MTGELQHSQAETFTPLCKLACYLKSINTFHWGLVEGSATESLKLFLHNTRYYNWAIIHLEKNTQGKTLSYHLSTIFLSGPETNDSFVISLLPYSFLNMKICLLFFVIRESKTNIFVSWTVARTINHSINRQNNRRVHRVTGLQL